MLIQSVFSSWDTRHLSFVIADHQGEMVGTRSHPHTLTANNERVNRYDNYLSLVIPTLCRWITCRHAVCNSGLPPCVCTSHFGRETASYRWLGVPHQPPYTIRSDALPTKLHHHFSCCHLAELKSHMWMILFLYEKFEEHSVTFYFNPVLNFLKIRTA